MKYIFTGFAPNMTRDDVRRACSFLLLPWKWFSWKQGCAGKRVEIWLQDYFHASRAVTYDSGRTALHAGLRALGVGPGDEVLVQAYTCVVVSNAIRHTGAKPIYVDIKNDLTMDPDDLAKKYTPKAKALVIQHTFGVPADLDSLLEFAKEHNLKTIEDCAHALGGQHRGKLLGTFADIGMFSFGSEKTVSCVRGGALITNNAQIGDQLYSEHDAMPALSFFRIKRHLLYYPVFAIGRRFYASGIGRVLLALSHKLRLTARIVSRKEKEGKKEVWFPARMPNALAAIVIHQLRGLQSNLEHRGDIVAQYRAHFVGVSAQRATFDCPVFVSDPYHIARKAKERGIMLGTSWTGAVIVPKDADSTAAQYNGDCPNAERLSKTVLLLPSTCHITPSDADRIIDVIDMYDESHR